MAVTTKLTWKEERSLQKLLGNISLRLLYKSSVHGNNIQNMNNKCIGQGPTITMIYLPEYTFGIFILGHYPEMGKNFKEPNNSFFFSFRKNETMKMTTAFLNSTLKITSEELRFDFAEFWSLHILSRNKNICIPKFLEEELGLPSDLSCRYSECEVFRVEGIKDDAGYISRITEATQHRNSLLEDLRDYKPYADLVSEIRILLLGPVGSGKSSFFNSVKSIFQGRLSRQAIVGSDITSITEQYRIYSIKYGIDGESLPFKLCDSMGLGEKEGVGLCVDDIPHILKGCVPDRYQFSPHKPITPKHPAFITSPSLKDGIHCVAYVFDINSMDNLSFEMRAKLIQVQKEVLNHGVAQVALLTKVKNSNEVLENNFSKMSKSMISQSQIIIASELLGIPVSKIFVVENYASEQEMDPVKDILILSALKQMLRAADDFLEDLPLE